jgi:hypothetical protein
VTYSYTQKEASKVVGDSKLRIPKCLQSLLAGAAVTTHEKPPRRGVLHYRRSWFRGRSVTTQCPALAPDAKAKSAYQDFFALWKDADSDIPILKEAKAEYAKIQ